jgi:pyruvate/2-oxoglutarate dehydrogenase complex dihydrolipoamide acyltransferase (E2) component
MPGIPIFLPALGEGIREVRVLARLKQSGEPIDRDEPVAEVETDKAAYVIESPASGVLDTWCVQPGETYPVGTLMTTILDPVEQSGLKLAPPAEAHHSITNPRGDLKLAEHPETHRQRLSPRVRAWCRNQGIDTDNLPDIPCEHPDGRLAISDIERWIELEKVQNPRTNVPTATIEVHVSWDALKSAADRREATTSELLAWCVARAMARRVKFRSTLVGPRLGVAVALLADGLAVAAVDEVPLDDGVEFGRAFHRAISAARTKPSSPSGCSLVLSDMSSFGVRSSTPIVVPPAVATCFLGEPFDVCGPGEGGIVWRREAKLILAFDHRIMNGVGAARFLRDVRLNIDAL